MSSRVHVYDMDEFLRGFRQIVAENKTILKKATVTIKVITDEMNNKVAIIPVPELEFFNDDDLADRITKIPGMAPVTTLVAKEAKKKI